MGSRRRWDLAEPYLREKLVWHARDAGRLDEVLADPEYLVHGSPESLTVALDGAVSGEARLCAAVYRASARLHASLSWQGRRDVLALDAARFGARELAAQLADGGPHPCLRPEWAIGLDVSAALRRTILTPHPMGPLIGTTVACTTVDGRPVAVSGNTDGVMRVWDLITGAHVGEPMVGKEGGVLGMECTVVGGRPVVVSGGFDGAVRVWDLATRLPLGNLTADDDGATLAVAGTLLHGRPVLVVSSGWVSALRVWDLGTGAPVGEPMVGHQGMVEAVACTVVGGALGCRQRRQ